MSTPEKTLERILNQRECPQEVALTAIEWGQAHAVVNRALQDKARLRKRIRLLTVGLTAAAASLVFFLLLPSSQQAQVSGAWGAAWNARAGKELRQLSQGDVLRTGDEIEVAEGGHVDVSFSEGSRVRLNEASRLQFESIGKKRRFNLRKGSISAQVVKLKIDEQFVVSTSHASVEVIGTQFRVEVLSDSNECAGGATRVQVTEGLVQVRLRNGQQHWVPPGDTLTVGCEALGEQRKPSRQDTVREETPKVRVDEETARALPPKPPSSLTRMNRLYEQAMQAKKQRNFEQAVKLLARLRREFPSGPLDEAAAVEGMRIHELQGGTRALQEARDYLEQFPNGYARDVAQEILDEAKP